MPEKKPWRLAEITLKDVRKARFQAAVLPFGATEPHNFHLPYATDNYEVADICDRACGWAWKKGARVALLPHIPFGSDNNMLNYPMTISLDQELLNAIVAAVARSLEHHGVLKLLIVNGHGGNNFQSGLRSLLGRTKVFCCLMNTWETMADAGREIFENPGEHADEAETSMVQAIAPHLVDLPAALDGGIYPSCFEAGRKGWVWYPRPWDRLTKNSGNGDPRKATAAKGRKFLERSGERIGNFLVELSRAKMDAAFPFDHSKPAKPPKRIRAGD